MPDVRRRAGVAARLLLALMLGGAVPAALALDPVDPEATPEARALLGYLADLPNRERQRVLSGQTIHGDLEAQYETYVTGFAELTGERPAVLQLVLYADWLEDRDRPAAHRSDAAVFPLAYNHANRGGQVIWLYRPNNPFTGQGNATLIPAGHTLADVATAGTDSNRVWEEDLRMLALQAARMEAAGIPVTICMFGGYNAKARRWHAPRGNPGSSWADFRAAWRHGVRTLREAGVHNVLWCLEEADGAARYRRRGWQEDWIDIQSIQAANDHETTGPAALYSAHVSASAKPIIYGQFLLRPPLRNSPPAYRYDEAVALLRESMPRVAAIVPWSAREGGGAAAPEDHSPTFHLNARAYADDPWLVHRGELDVSFGERGRAQLPVARDPIRMSGRYTENFDDDASAWTPGENGAARAVPAGDGILDVFFFGDDPVLELDGAGMPARYDRLRVRLRNNSLADRVELSWRRTSDDDWSDERRVAVSVRPMGLYLEEYAADLAGHPRWNGTIEALRLHLNPGHRFGGAELDYIKFDTRGGRPRTALFNSRFEYSLGAGWTIEDRAAPTAELARYRADRRRGDHSLLLFLRDHENDGIAQDVTGVFAARGPGVYRFGAHFKLPATADARRETPTRALLRIESPGETVIHLAEGKATRHEWAAAEGLARIGFAKPPERATFVLRTGGTTEDILVDDAFFELVNGAPRLAAVGDRAAVARQTLTFEVTATDADGPSPPSLSAATLPAGASFVDLGDGRGTFEWKPGDDDVGGTHVVRITATDDIDPALTASETFEIRVAESPWDGDLDVTATDPGARAYDLGAAGTSDWKHFGRDGAGHENRKAGLPDLIGGYTEVGSPRVTRYVGDAWTRPAFTWSDGTPAANEPGTRAGLSFGGGGAGYELALPADRRLRTARIHLGGFNARGRLEAGISDGSAPVHAELFGGEGAFDRIVTVSYRAGTAGSRLNLRYVVEEDLGGGHVTLAAVALAAPVTLPFEDGFADPGAGGWSLPIDETESAAVWHVRAGGMRQSVRLDYAGSFEESYHVGTYRYLADGAGLADYRARVTVTPEDPTVVDDIGLMVRYRDPDNYYRLSQNARHGYTRLEKRENGVFSTLGVTAAGYEPGATVTYDIEAIGAELLVSVDGRRVFAVRDDAHPRGSIALYTQDAAIFDEVSILPAEASPRIAIRRPLSGAVVPGDRLVIEAAALDAPPGSEVVIEVDGFAPERYAAPPYALSLNGIPAGEYTVTARLLEAPGGNPLSSQTIDAVAVGGHYLLALGDSNTNGLGDTFQADNRLARRIRSMQGYAGTLASLLDAMTPAAHVIFNEGVSGDTVADARVARLGSVLERHPAADGVLLALGTNDVSGGRPSGELCAAGDADCLEGTIRGDLQAIVDELRAAGLTVWTATVPPAWPNGEPTPGKPRIVATRELNRVIRDGLTGAEPGPDLFGFFYADTDGDGAPDLARRSLYADRFHFNGLGHRVVALLWYNALAGDATGTSIAPFILSEPSVEGYQQNLLDPGDDFRIDTFDTLISFPDVLADGIWVMTAQADARSTDPGFLSFGVGDRPVDVYVAYDAAAARLPGWLDPAAGAFAAVDGQIVTSDGRFDLYRRSYQAGERVVLGGNAADGDGETARMFIPIVVDRTAR